MSTSLEARLTKKVPFVLRDVDPTNADYHFDPPHLWLNRETDTTFLLTDVTSEVATWIEVAVLGEDDNYVTDAEKAALHAAGGDTTLGAQTENLNMNSHQIEVLSVPAAAGEAIRQTVKITEELLENLNTYIVATGETLTIPTNKQSYLIEQMVIEGTGILSIEGTGVLAIAN